MIGAGQILYNGDVDEMKHKAFKVKGTRQQVTEFVKDKKVIFKQLCETNNMAFTMYIKYGIRIWPGKINRAI